MEEEEEEEQEEQEEQEQEECFQNFTRELVAVMGGSSSMGVYSGAVVWVCTVEQ